MNSIPGYIDSSFTALDAHYSSLSQSPQASGVSGVRSTSRALSGRNSASHGKGCSAFVRRIFGMRSETKNQRYKKLETEVNKLLQREASAAETNLMPPILTRTAGPGGAEVISVVWPMSSGRDVELHGLSSDEARFVTDYWFLCHTSEEMDQLLEVQSASIREISIAETVDFFPASSRGRSTEADTKQARKGPPPLY